MIDISVKMKDFVSLANPVLAATRNVVVKTLLKTPKVGDYIREARFKPPPTYPNGAYFGLPRRRRNGAEGGRSRSRMVRTYEGRRALLDDILGEDFALVGYGCDPRAGLDAQDPRAALRARRAVRGALPFGGRPQGDGVEPGAPAGALVEVEDLGGEGDRLVPRRGRAKGRCRPHPARQVRLRADAGGTVPRRRETGARPLWSAGAQATGSARPKGRGVGRRSPGAFGKAAASAPRPRLASMMIR